MRVFSYIDDDFELMKAEVCINLMPGLPDLKIIGLPDSGIKESGIRIKSALKTQGFKWPKKHQIIVHIKPTNIKKKSQGLDLAIAAGILKETKQITLDCDTYYGELGLKGDVTVPSDIFELTPNGMLCTGKCKTLRFESLQIENLSQISNPEKIGVSREKFEVERPTPPDFIISNQQFKVLSIIASGEHNTLFVGSPGTSKTTSLDIISKSLINPTIDMFLESRAIHRRFGKNLNWRPIENPHHTSSHIAVIGGGNPIKAGSVTRSHNGVLMMDELLEFSNLVQESLREPLEKKTIYIARSSGVKAMPADFLFLATTNLCKCGNYLPHDSRNCSCSSYRLQRYLDKISGPVFDRFQITYVSDSFMGKQNIDSSKIYSKVLDAYEFRKNIRGQSKPNGKLSPVETFMLDKQNNFDRFFPELSKQNRKKIAILKVARTIADLENHKNISTDHLNEAYKLSYDTLYKIQNPIY